MFSNVIITTSGLGSRLGEITEYTNKCLVRVDDKPAISHIIEKYPKDTNFIITLGHYGTHVKQFLNLVYPELKFEFVEIDKYQGSGSSLGYTLSKCKNFINGPFIFHACDTILNFTNFEHHNFIVGSKKINASQYRTLKHGSNKIYDKGEIDYDLAYVGVCGIQNHNLFFEILDTLLEENIDEISEVDVINLMSKYTYFDIVEANCWHDIGNSSELLATRKNFEKSYNVLDKPQESIFFLNDYVVKFFNDKNIVEKRVKRSKILGAKVPEILNNSENFYIYKKINADLLSDTVTPSNFLKLLNWCKNNLWNSINKDNFEDICKKFYYNKTLDRINLYLSKYSDEVEIINDLEIPSIHNLLSKINFDDLSKGIPVNFHGDFILDNILYDGKDFTLLDWRQDFENSLDAGDIYYDFAKLNHNLTLNHDVLEKCLYTFERLNKNKARCEVLIPSINIECKKIYDDWLIQNEYDLQKIELITSLVWLNMAILHEYPLNNFIYYYGKYKLFLNLRDNYA